jgi:hypothetical protein
VVFILGFRNNNQAKIINTTDFRYCTVLTVRRQHLWLSKPNPATSAARIM